MKPNEKFRIVEESRFLENGEMSQISGGSCSDGTSLVQSCSRDDFYFNCSSLNTYQICADYGVSECYWFVTCDDTYQSCTNSGYILCTSINVYSDIFE